MDEEPKSPLEGKRIGVTAGPTRAWIDPVRYIANASTGALGGMISDGLAERGARVDLILGDGGAIPHHTNVRVSPIQTVGDLQERLKVFSADTEDPFFAWIHAMAVLDYVPADPSTEKIPSDTEEWVLNLRRTPKVIAEFASLFPHSLLIGFKLETTNNVAALKRSAVRLGRQFNCDLIVANRSPFQDPQNHEALFWERESDAWRGPYHRKESIATGLIDWLETKVPLDVHP